MNEQYFSELNGYLVKDSRAIHTYDSIASMKADTKLKEGYHVKTKGYYESNDGGFGEYVIVDDNTLIDDGGSIHVLENGLRAVLIIENQEMNIKQFGVKGDGVTDETSILQNCINKYEKVFIPNGNYVVSDTIVIPKNHKIIGESMDNTIIYASCSGKYVFQYMQSYDYQSFNALIDNLTITKPQSLEDRPKGIDFTNGSMKLTNLKLIQISNPIHAGTQYKDNIYLENITATYSPGYSASDYFFDINCNCDNLYMNQIRAGFSLEDFTDDIQHSMRIRNCTGGVLNNLTLGNNLVIDRCNNLQVNSVHCENNVGAQIKISNSFISMNNLLKWKNPTTADIVISSDSRGNNSNVYLNNVEFSFYPSTSSQTVPSSNTIQTDTWSNLTCNNVKCRLQLQKVNNIHTNILFQPTQLNPYNNKLTLPSKFSVKTYGSSAALNTYYPTNMSLEWKGGSYNKFIFVITDSPNSNKYVNKTNALTIENSCYFHLRNGDNIPRNCYVVIYGSADDGVTYTRKWVLPLDDLGLIITNGENFNLSTYETDTDYSTEISNYILCTHINYENENYKLYCSTLVNTTYNNGDEIVLPSTKYLYINNTLKEFTLV